MSRLAIALVHHPVLARDGSETTSTVTNLDLHDISRSAKTYGLGDFFVIHPVAAQRDLVARIVEHWKTGASGERIPTRAPALVLVRPVATLDDAFSALGGRSEIVVWATAARAADGAAVLAFPAARTALETSKKSVLLLFGTSWGLPARVLGDSDAVLEPIQKNAEYNHLSVRAACAIALDRLLG